MSSFFRFMPASSPLRIILTFILTISSLLVNSQISTESGFFNIRNYSPKEYNAKSQNWAIVQDKRGVMYFGNNDGILEYDGVNWRVIKTEEGTLVRSLAIDNKGIIYVGATGEFGFLASDSKGKYKYFVSLQDSLKKEGSNDFEDVWKTIATNDGEVYFQTSNKIFRWDGQKIKVWNADNEKPFSLMFYVKGSLYVRQKEVGLMKMVNDQLELIPGGELFAKDFIPFMLPFKNNQIIFSAKSKGLFTMSTGNEPKIKAFPIQSQNFITDNFVYDGVALGNGYYSIGTFGAGIAVIDSLGNFLGSMDENTGLQAGTVNYQYLDDQQNLWLALNNGISKIEINAPITYFNNKNGLSGTVQSIVRHNGMLYAASNLGVFYLDNLNAKTYLQSDFKKLEAFSEECWDLLALNDSKKDALLVAANNGVFEIKNKKINAILREANASTLYSSLKDSSRVFIGLIDGLCSIYWNNGKWEYEGKIKNIDADIRSIVEDEKGNLWLGTNNNGVVKLNLTFKNKKIIDSQIIVNNSRGIKEDENVLVKKVLGKTIFAVEKGILKYSSEKTDFLYNSSFGSQFADSSRGIHRIVEDKEGNVWMVTYTNTLQKKSIEIGFLKPQADGTFLWTTTPFKGLSKTVEIIHAIYPDKNGIVWFGGPDGIFRYNSNVKKDYSQNFNVIIRKVITGEDSILFSGTYFDDSRFFLDSSRYVSLIQPENLKPTLPYKNNSLITFEFAAPSFENESTNRYRYCLVEGNDENHWSEWKKETKVDYTNLSEGHYYFKVKAKNIYGHESQEAVYEFTISPPWYRTLWAYIGYVLGFIGFVYGAVVISTRGLRSIIKERTAEIVKQKEEIEYKNKDITDSINYAKRIQEAILPSGEYVKSLFPESFILYKPKDIVSGDFYWLTEKNNKVSIAAADCTGHGVPGAFMSMIGNSLLNEIVNDKGITEPSRVLHFLREGIIRSLKQKGKEGESKDGMDIAFCTIDFHEKRLQYAGANNALFLIRENELIEIKANKFPIGISDNQQPFTNNEMSIQEGDAVYLFSDGYADQFGGSEGKKYMRKRFKQSLLDIQQLNMEEQKKQLDKIIMEWRGEIEQVDDILIIGLKFY